MNGAAPRIVDAHCHVDLFPDMDEIAFKADEAEVATIAVTTTPRAWPRNRDLAAKTRYVTAALGLHPQLVNDDPRELEIWDSFLPEAKVIGEVGLDASPRYYKTLERQKAVFTHILQKCAEEGNKVLSVHSVRAARITLELLEAHLGGNCIVILHWFTGTVAEARRASALGCYFSVNAEMTGNSRHAEMIRSLPSDRLLTETDGPFTQSEGRPSRPEDAMVAAASLSRILGVPKEALCHAVSRNFVLLMNGENQQFS